MKKQLTTLTLILSISISNILNATETAGSTNDPSSELTSIGINYEQIFRKILYSEASLSDVRQSLTEQNPAALTNTIHALYNMRWHRGVINLLNGMWSNNNKKYPEIAWDLIAKPPVRIALASTINRIKIVNTSEYQEYIRTFKNHEHEFIRAQVTVALGFNGDPTDVDYIKEMSDGNNHYVAQSAITGLGLMGNKKAKESLIALQKKYVNQPRGELIDDILHKIYEWPEKQ